LTSFLAEYLQEEMTETEFFQISQLNWNLTTGEQILGDSALSHAILLTEKFLSEQNCQISNQSNERTLSDCLTALGNLGAQASSVAGILAKTAGAQAILAIALSSASAPLLALGVAATVLNMATGTSLLSGTPVGGAISGIASNCGCLRNSCPGSRSCSGSTLVIEVATCSYFSCGTETQEIPCGELCNKQCGVGEDGSTLGCVDICTGCTSTRTACQGSVFGHIDNKCDCSGSCTEIFTPVQDCSQLCNKYCYYEADQINFGCVDQCTSCPASHTDCQGTIAGTTDWNCACNGVCEPTFTPSQDCSQLCNKYCYYEADQINLGCVDECTSCPPPLNCNCQGVCG